MYFGLSALLGNKILTVCLDEFEFRFNNEENSFLFRDTLLRLLNSTNLQYKHLIADEDEAAMPDVETVPF